MARTDLRINQFGVDGAAIKVGDIVLIAWKDAEPDYDLVTEVSGEKPTYKGERSLRTLNAQTSVQHTQVMQVHSTLRLPSVPKHKRNIRLA